MMVQRADFTLQDNEGEGQAQLQKKDKTTVSA